MIRRLYLNNCFLHQDRTFTFEKGLTGLIGPNESGKSLITEMVRYALFGSAALRSDASDYKGLHVELDFEVAGVDYTVVRKGTTVALSGGQQASGTRPVNAAIIDILGYDLLVFDVANACNQGNVEALSNMRPADRKKMVDQTVGLNVLDDLIKLCGAEGNNKRREAQAFESAMIEPATPEVPAETVDRETYDAALAKANEYRELKGFLSSTPAKPVAPGAAPCQETAAELTEARENHTLLARSVANTEKQIAAVEMPSVSLEELDRLEALHDAADQWGRKQKLLSQGHHECPKCAHQWPVADLGDLEDVEEVERPGVSRAKIAAERKLHDNETQLASLNERLETLKTALAEAPDVDPELIETRRQWEADQATYESMARAYDTHMAQLEAKQARFAQLEGSVEEADRLRELFQQGETYRKLLAEYERLKRQYDANVAQHAKLVELSEAYLESRTAIVDLKQRVKAHLLPSLNAVASRLLSQMTGGERTLIAVNEEFEILVDGQKIVTLSGSGKAVANLAVRIALGQILTNRVFSVFMADEIDASMDEERAGHTAEALRRLTDTVGQVIQVTHKRPVTDHTIELTK